MPGVDHTPAFACLPMHAPPSLGDWAVWADWLVLYDPKPWRDARIRRRLLRGSPNSVERPLSMACAYRPAELRPGVFAWGEYEAELTEYGWSHTPRTIPWEVAWSSWAAPDTIYVHPGIYRAYRAGQHVAANDVGAHLQRVKRARNPRKRADTGEHKRGRRR